MTKDGRLTVGMTLLTVITIHIARDSATFFSPADIHVDIWLTSAFGIARVEGEVLCFIIGVPRKIKFIII